MYIDAGKYDCCTWGPTTNKFAANVPMKSGQVNTVLTAAKHRSELKVDTDVCYKDERNKMEMGDSDVAHFQTEVHRPIPDSGRRRVLSVMKRPQLPANERLRSDPADPTIM